MFSRRMPSAHIALAAAFLGNMLTGRAEPPRRPVYSYTPPTPAQVTAEERKKRRAKIAKASRRRNRAN